MSMLRIAVCDDEPKMADALSSLVSACLAEKGAAEHTIERFPNGRALLGSGAEHDLIFLDIRLDGSADVLPAAPAASTDPAAPLTGMQTARLLREQGSGSLLVFVTVLPEYVFDAFSVEAFDYLVKPVDPARLAQTMARALQTLARRAEQGFVVRQPGGSEVVRPCELGWCEVQGRKVYLHRTDGTVIAYYDRLQRLQQRLDGRFFRCHRSYLVNLDEIRGCAGGLIALRQGEKVPLSRLREGELTAALLRRMKGREG